MACLVAIRGPGTGKRYDLHEECILGRSFNSDIYIGDLNVSRRHARVCRQGEEGYLVEDLGSGNGTFVNDRQISRHPLNPMDVIRIGGSSFRYEPDDARWAPEVLTIIADGVVPEAGDLRIKTDVEQLTKVGSDSEVLVTPGDGRALKMLEAMYAVADAIAVEVELDKLLDKVLDHLFAVFPQADRGFVLLVNPHTGQLVPEAVKQRRGESAGGLKFSQTMVDQLLERGQGMIRGNTVPPGITRPASPAPRPKTSTEDGYLTDGEDRFSLDEQALAATTSSTVPKMGAPLTCRGTALGTLHLEARSTKASFTEDDLALLSAIARQAAVAIANARASQALFGQQRLEADLKLARKIQESFLPQQLPQVRGLEFHAHYVPALHVGGDFYDVIQVAPSQIAILVGDISGKGVSAALLMAKLTTDIRVLSRSGQTPAEVLTQANRLLSASGHDAMFATVLYLLLDLDHRTFTVANAGHQPPMVCSRRFAGTSELDDATAVALGVLPDTVYPQEVYQLIPGDVVLLYTDGINEAQNRHGQEYGMARLRHAVANGPADPRQVVQRLVADVQRFVGSTAQSDDQTLVAFGVTARDLTGPVRLPLPHS
ncbi:MAG: SpoIIE family protein phosphatase [Deltaproteobacteria bacterium]|nr:SpoIIE family protein phosphatase [Deltaproteobacteria bacterium]